MVKKVRVSVAVRWVKELGRSVLFNAARSISSAFFDETAEEDGTHS